MRSAMMTVGLGMTILKQFSMVLPLSKRRISCVPVPTSTARIWIGMDMEYTPASVKGCFLSAVPFTFQEGQSVLVIVVYHAATKHVTYTDCRTSAAMSLVLLLESPL